MDAFIVIAGFIGFFLGFAWPWMWIFPIILIVLLCHEKYESIKLDKQLAEVKKNYVPPPDPVIGMREEYSKITGLVWGWPNDIKTTITDGCTEREYHFNHRGKLIFQNGVLVKIIKFDTNSRF